MRRFFNLKTFVMFVMAASLLTFTGCKDYDDDINNLRQEIEGLKGMKTELNDAINAVKASVVSAAKTATDAQAAADNAKAAADKAQQTADEAKAKGSAGAEAAKKAAEAAKAAAEKAQKAADAAKKAAEEAKAKGAKLEEELNLLKARVAELEKGSGTTPPPAGGDNEKALEELKAKIAEVMKKVEAFVGNRLTSIALIPDFHINGIAAINIESMQYDVQTPIVHDRYGKVTKSTGTTRILGGDETEVDFRISPRYVTKEALGIPYIESWKSKNMITKGQAIEKNKPIAPATDKDGKLLFELTDEGVLKMNFKKTVEASIKEKWLDNAKTKEEFYMVSLAIPVAEKYWTAAEKEAKIVPTVTSEAYRLTETTVTPKIKSTKAGNAVAYYTLDIKGHKHDTDFMTDHQSHRVVGVKHYYEYTVDIDENPLHYSDSTLLYQSGVDQLIDEKVDWKKGIDLMTLVSTCTTDDHSDFDYKKHGLAFKFAIAEGEYMQGVNKTDQQKFAEIEAPKKSKDGKTTEVWLKSRVYTIGGSTQTAIGREPIIRVDLVNTEKDNELVDRRYIKIKWEKKVDVRDLPQHDFTNDNWVSCNNVADTLKTQEMNEKIYRKVEEKFGISKEQFHGIYKNIYIKSLKRGDDVIENTKEYDKNSPKAVTPSEPNYGLNFQSNEMASTEDVIFYMIPDANDNTSYNLVWAMSPKAVDTIPVKDKVQTYKVSIVFKSSVKGYEDINMDFTTSVKLPEQDFSYQGIYWNDGKGGTRFNVNPIVYDSKEDGYFKNGNTPALTDYSHIEADIVDGYLYNETNKKPANLAQFIAYIRKCAKVRFEFAKERFDEYTVKDAKGKDIKYLDGYTTSNENTELFKGTSATLANHDYIQTDNVAATITNNFGATAAENKKNLEWDQYNEDLGSKKNEATAIIRLHEKDKKNGTPAAVELVGKAVPVNLVVEYNDYNKVPVQEIEVFFIDPLKVNGKIDGSFTDAVVDGSFVSVEEGFGFTDWNQYKVSKKAVAGSDQLSKYAEQLYEYYAVKSVIFDTKSTTTNLQYNNNTKTYEPTPGVTDGNLPTNRSVFALNHVDLTQTPPKYDKMDVEDANGNITNEQSATNPATHLGYFNANGSPVNVNYSMFINVEVGYKWGKLKKSGLEIKVNKAVGTP